MWKIFSPRSLLSVNLPWICIRDNEERCDLFLGKSDQCKNTVLGHSHLLQQIRLCIAGTCNQPDHSKGDRALQGWWQEQRHINVSICWTIICSKSQKMGTQEWCAQVNYLEPVGEQKLCLPSLPVAKLYSCELRMKPLKWKSSWIRFWNNPHTQQHSITLPVSRR